MTFQCIQHDTVDAFWDLAGSLLMESQSENNRILGFIQGARAGEGRWPDFRLFSVGSGENIVGHALQAAPDATLILSPMAQDIRSCLMDSLVDAGASPGGVSGLEPHVTAFAGEWADRTGVAYDLNLKQGLYEATDIVAPDDAGGQMVMAGEGDAALVTRYVRGFIHDCFPEEADPDARAEGIVKRLLPPGHMALWRDAAGEPVSMAARNRETPDTATISLVYTPPEHRGGGYGTRVVAALSRAQLRSGKGACNLNADLLNPVSTGIYHKIGYNRLGESRTYLFR
ncbi:MAG: GNAT family N-acetyltransferase [Myxococcota bacterium]|nr:GNAT family N-acetyltransferase [Myxococcota bacterium]